MFDVSPSPFFVEGIDREWWPFRLGSGGGSQPWSGRQTGTNDSCCEKMSSVHNLEVLSTRDLLPAFLFAGEFVLALFLMRAPGIPVDISRGQTGGSPPNAS
jgi:hypothetical protein